MQSTGGCNPCKSHSLKVNHRCPTELNMELAGLLWYSKALAEKWDSDSWDMALGEAYT